MDLDSGDEPKTATAGIESWKGLHSTDDDVFVYVCILTPFNCLTQARVKVHRKFS